jgi:deoxyribose-phosphate aldolase
MTAKPNLTLVTSPRPLPDGHVERNPGMPLDLDVVRAIRVNRSAVERRAATLSTRRTVKKEWQAAWLLRAITLIDLTTLSGDDTPGNVRRLCAKARHPLRDDITDALGVADLDIKVGAVCVYHSLVRTAVDALAGSGVPVAAVSTGFPAGLSPIEQRVDEIRASVAAGAAEIDIVITRAHVLTGNFEALYDEVRRFREACGNAHMKAILATGELATLGNVARASMVAMQAGADFIKTSTGKEGVNATIPFGVLADRVRRTTVLGLVIFLWAAAMLWSASVANFHELLLARLCLGAVVAAAGPLCASLIGEGMLAAHSALHELCQGCRDPVALFTIPQGVLLDVNRSFRTLFGIPDPLPPDLTPSVSCDTVLGATRAT